MNEKNEMALSLLPQLTDGYEWDCYKEHEDAA